MQLLLPDRYIVEDKIYSHCPLSNILLLLLLLLEIYIFDNNEPLEYGYVGDRDILWSKMVWESIVLEEKVNFPLYYPVDTNNIGKERRCLYDVLMKNIKNDSIKNIYADSYFTEKVTNITASSGTVTITQ